MATNKRLLPLETKIIAGKRYKSGQTANQVHEAMGINPSQVYKYGKELESMIEEWKQTRPGQPVPEIPGANAAPIVVNGASAPADDGVALALASLRTVKARLREHIRTMETPDIVYLQAQAALTAMGG